MNVTDAQQILNLKGNVKKEEIRRAFRQMAMRYHPDRYHTSSQQAYATYRFIKIKAAYDFLMNLHRTDNNNAGESRDAVSEKEYFRSSSISATETKESSNNVFDLVDWIVRKLPDVDSRIGKILDVVMSPFIMFLVMIWAMYEFTVLIFLTGLFNLIGFKSNKYCSGLENRFANLILNTIGIPVFLVLLLILMSSANRDGGMFNKIMYLVSLGMLVIYLLSEWISYFLTLKWYSTIRSDLDKISSAEQVG